MATLLDNQIGFADESTYGTRVAPVRFLDFVSEGLARQQVNRVSAGLRKGQKVQRSDGISVANQGAQGPLVLNPAITGFGLILKHLFGKAPVITGTGPYVMTFTLGDGAGISLTTQVGKPTPAGTVQPHDFLGCKIPDGTFSQAIDADLELQLTVDANSDVTNQTLATASYPAAREILHDGMLTIMVNSTEFDSKTSTLKIDRQLDTGRRFMRSSTLKKEPLPLNLAQVTGTLDGEFLDYTTYALFVAGTAVPITFTWTAVSGSLAITLPACQLNGPQPVTSKPGILDAATPFTVLYDGTDEPITAVLTTTDSLI